MKVMEMETIVSGKVHHGQNIKHLRDLLGIKQETIATGLHITQQAMSKLEQKEKLDDELLTKISEILNISFESIKNLDDKTVITIMSNLFHETSLPVSYQTNLNLLDKVVELYERLLQAEQAKNALLEKLVEDLKGKK